MNCWSKKNLFIILAVVGVGIVIAKIANLNIAVFLPFLALLACPLMCVIMALFMKDSSHAKSNHSHEDYSSSDSGDE